MAVDIYVPGINEYSWTDEDGQPIAIRPYCNGLIVLPETALEVFVVSVQRQSKVKYQMIKTGYIGSFIIDNARDIIQKQAVKEV